MAVPYQLTFYYVTRLLVENHADLKHSVNAPESLGMNIYVSEERLDISGIPGVNNEDELDQRITLRVATKKSDDASSPLPWHFELELNGYFKIDAGFAKQENYKDLFAVNGLSTLWSTAREIIRQATTYSPYATALLPTISFNKNVPKVATEPESN